MNKRLEWDIYDKYNYILHYIRYRKYQMIFKLTGKKYWAMPKIVAGRILLSVEQTNKLIGEAILAGEPYWAGRFGGTEMNMVYAVLAHRFHPERDERLEGVKKLCDLSGFFPCDLELAEQFVDLLLKDCTEIDLEGKWRRYMEDYLYAVYQRNTKLSQIFHLEPWNMYQYRNTKIKPWSAALKGKKVLVIHPFVETIQKQYYDNREKIFNKIYASEDILPQFELKTLKAVQTLAGEQDGRFRTWFDALDWMKGECHRIDFDVAVIGCGAYGYPLAAEIKRMGKIAIHLGGATQILFGIIGARWEAENPRFCKEVVNEYWVRPKASEKIQNAQSVEAGCYW